MKCSNKVTLAALSLVFVCAFYTPLTIADGMVPETSLLMIDEANRGGSISIKNTGKEPALLYTKITDLADDSGITVLATQPVVRVEAGETQQVRFIMKNDKPLTVEHFKRVVFEGIPQKKPGKGTLSLNVRQDLPVLIRPANLPEVKDAWKLLTWKVSDKKVSVTNSSPYVVRMSLQAQLLPSNSNITLDKTYILPGQTLTSYTNKNITKDTSVKFYPVSRYGVQIPGFIAKLN